MSAPSLLESLLSKSNTGNEVRPAVKVARTEHYDFPVGQKLYSALMTIWLNVQKNSEIDKSRVEIEARVGMLVRGDSRWHHVTSSRAAAVMDEEERNRRGLNYKSGIDKAFYFKHLRRNILTNENRYKLLSQTEQVLRSNSSSLRWTFTEGLSTLAELKQRFFRWNFGLLSHYYDIRLDAAQELPLDDKSSVDFNSWTQERRKRRSTYVSERYQNWKIDLTEVFVSNRDKAINNDSSFVEYELEFELNNQATVKWLSLKLQQDAEREAGALCESLEGILNDCIPSENEILNEVTFESATSKELLQSVTILNENLIQTCSYLYENKISASNFLGALPTNLSRAGMAILKEREYFVTEKSDGVRYMLYVVNDRGQPVAVMVNRSREAYIIGGAAALGSALGVGTVLDCELVSNITYSSQMILVFDVLSYDGKICAHQQFSDRLKILNGIISDRMARYIESSHSNRGKEGGKSSALKYIVRKKYLKKCEISQLLAIIHQENGERVYREKDGRRHHRTDGLIFQPALAPYKFFSDHSLMKWKWSELRSVDLIASCSFANRGTNSESYPVINLACTGPEGIIVDCSRHGGQQTGLSRFDSYRLLADISAPDINGAQGVQRIVEVMFDVEIGQWRYLKFRRDKNKPNFIDTVLSVFIEQAEDISIEELEYSLIANLECSAYQVRLQECKHRILNELKKDLAK